jgi:hypothetical protein
MRHDGGDLRRRHAARAGRKDETNCIGTSLSGQLRVRE